MAKRMKKPEIVEVSGLRRGCETAGMLRALDSGSRNARMHPEGQAMHEPASMGRKEDDRGAGHLAWAGVPSVGTAPILRPLAAGAPRELAALLAEEFLDSMASEGLLAESDRDAECTASYLLRLLNELASPAGLARYGEYWSDTETGLSERLVRSQSHRDRLALYRTNADYILLSLGLFDRAPVGRAGRGQGVHSKRRDIESRGTHYYHLASGQAEVLYGPRGDLTRIMETLAARFPGYCHALRTVGSHSFGLVRRLGPGEEFHLLRDAEGMALAQRIRRRQEHLLETFAAWRRLGSERARERVLRARLMA